MPTIGFISSADLQSSQTESRTFEYRKNKSPMWKHHRSTGAFDKTRSCSDPNINPVASHATDIDSRWFAVPGSIQKLDKNTRPHLKGKRLQQSKITEENQRERAHRSEIRHLGSEELRKGTSQPREAYSCAACRSGSRIKVTGTRRSRRDSVARKLHEEILQYATQTRAVVTTMNVCITQTIHDVTQIVQSLWPHSTLEPFGSYSTGLWLPSSDIDLVVLNVSDNLDTSAAIANLRKLSSDLQEQSWVASVLVLDTAKVPVLKLVSTHGSIPIDITFETSCTHSGLLARDLVRKYAKDIPELYPMAILFKQLLRERDLNDTYRGGLSSYSLVLMLIHFSLLRKYGKHCFQAAAMYAGGDTVPIAYKHLEKATDCEKGSEKHDGTLKCKAKQTCTDSTPSYAAILAKPAQSCAKCTLKRQITDMKHDSCLKPASYAAITSGQIKLEKPCTQIEPSILKASYASVAAAPPKVIQCLSKKKKEQSDAMSVTSNADTEDSSCSSPISASTLVESLYSQEGPTNLGEFTIDFLEFYGSIFDPHQNGLSIRDGGYIYRLADPEIIGIKPALVIEDPIHPELNVSASSFAFPRVAALFEVLFYSLSFFHPTRFAPNALQCLLKETHPTPFIK